MDLLSSILGGEDPFSGPTPTPQQAQTPPTSPTLALKPVPERVEVLGLRPNTPQTIPNKPPTHPQPCPDVGEIVGDVGGTLETPPNTFPSSQTAHSPVVGDVGGGKGCLARDMWTLARFELAPVLKQAAYPLYLACKWGAFLVMLRRFTVPTADPIGETRQALEQRPHLLHAAQVHALEVLTHSGEVLGRAEVPTLTLPPVCSRCHHWTPGAQGVGECAQSWTDTMAGTLCDVAGTRGQGFAFRSRTP